MSAATPDPGPEAPSHGAAPTSAEVTAAAAAVRPQRARRPRVHRIRGARTPLPPRGPHRDHHGVTRADVARRGLPGPPDLTPELLDAALTARARPEVGWIYDGGAWRVRTRDDDEPWHERGTVAPEDHEQRDVDDLLADLAAHRAARERLDAWLSGEADEAEVRRVAAVVAERAAMAAAREHAERLRAAQASVGRAQGAQVRTLAAMASLYRRAVHHPDTDPDEQPDDGAGPASAARRRREELEQLGLYDLVDEVALLLGWTESRAGELVHLAEHLVQHLPRTLERLEAGRLELAQVKVVADHTRDLDGQLTWEVDDELFGDGGTGIGLTTAQLRAEVDRIVAVKDASAVKRRSQRRVSARRVSLEPLGNGISRLVAVGPTTALMAAKEHLDAVAAANLAEARRAAAEGRVAADGGDPYAEPAPDAPGPAEGAAPPDLRGLAAHTFDAYVRGLCGAVPTDPEAPAPTTTLELHVTLPALCGASDDPAFLEGYGWLPAWLARRGLPWATCRIRRVLTDPFTGDLITVDGHTYPASWLTDPGPPSPGGSSGGAPPPPEDPPNPSAGTFRGQPLQDLPPTRTEDEAFGPAVETSGPPADASPPPVDDATSHAADPCDDGTCAPASPHDCPVSAVEGGGPYAPTTLLDRVVRRRWERCTHPGCTRRASRCDVDHVMAHRRGGTATGGGTTCACNLEPKCRRHHLLKHGFPGHGAPADDGDLVPGWLRWTARWQQWRCDQGSSHWRSPLGHDHRSRPRPAGPAAERFRPTPWPPRDPDAELLAGRRHTGAPLTVVTAEGPRAAAAPVARVVFPDEPAF